MKKMKKLVSILLTLVMVIAMAAPAFADEPASTFTLTIENAKKGHTYKAYQIFTGDVPDAEKDKNEVTSEHVLSNVEWSENVSSDARKKIINYLRIGKENPTATDVAEAMAKITTAEDAKGLAKAIKEALGEDADAVATNKVVADGDSTFTLAAGYYLVTDEDTNPNEDEQGEVISAFIMQVVGDASAKPKTTEIPEVDKQVKDEADDKDTDSEDAEGWGETADHAINETFQFKLKATVPAGVLTSYDTYKLIFHDSWSEGVTYVGNVKITVNGEDKTKELPEEKIVADDATLTITIDNLKSFITDSTQWENEVVVEVTYDAHLNEQAKLNNDPGNVNNVYLEYSNNPNGEGTGKTTTDTVYVFTYEVDNKKLDATGSEKKALAGAGFTLYEANLSDEGELLKSEDVKYEPGAAIEFYKDEEGKYYPYVAGKEKAPLVSGIDGTFNIYGLDAGTYILVETDTPAGYNTCDDIVIKIDAQHYEDGDSAKTVTPEQDTFVVPQNDIDNKKGSVLPSTGGMGTTIFYIVGAVLVIGAGILLVTKKKMSHEE